MAYSNWGAFVYKNGERRTDREDVAPFSDSEKGLPSATRIWGNLLRLRGKYGGDKYPAWERCRHAVLGDDAVRLCGYKCYPELWVMRNGDVEKVELPEWDWNDEATMTQTGDVEVEGRKWLWSFDYDGENMIDLELTEPDGSKWAARCGYCYGAGFEG